MSLLTQKTELIDMNERNLFNLRVRRSIDFFQRANQAFPDSLLPILKVGFYLRETGKYAESISTFQQVLTTGSTYYLSYYHIGTSTWLWNLKAMNK